MPEMGRYAGMDRGWKALDRKGDLGVVRLDVLADFKVVDGITQGAEYREKMGEVGT